MSMRLRAGLLVKAIGISICLNSVMIVAGVIGDSVKALSWVGWISNAIAAPPGLIIRLVIHLGGHSVSAYIMEAIGAVVCSIAFYAILAWVILLFVARRETSNFKKR